VRRGRRRRIFGFWNLTVEPEEREWIRGTRNLFGRTALTAGRGSVNLRRTASAVQFQHGPFSRLRNGSCFGASSTRSAWKEPASEKTNHDARQIRRDLFGWIHGRSPGAYTQSGEDGSCAGSIHRHYKLHYCSSQVVGLFQGRFRVWTRLRRPVRERSFYSSPDLWQLELACRAARGTDRPRSPEKMINKVSQ
jgi:hypothetical protein